jgi:WD40 repeat protein
MRIQIVMPVTLLLVQIGLLPGSIAAQPLPPAARTPTLVLNHASPHAPITALAFSPDGTTLYVGGLDKFVRRYALKEGRFMPLEPWRVPVGPGLSGAINAVAVSPDGKWVAVAGRAPVRGESWTSTHDGISTNTQYLSPTMKQDFGVVYLFDPANPQGGKVIRGPESAVRSIQFANPPPANGHVLITAGIEWLAENRSEVGVVRVFDVATGQQLDMRSNFPNTPTKPGLAAWATGPDRKQLTVAVSWRKPGNGELTLWAVPGGKVQSFEEKEASFPLAVRLGAEGDVQEIVSTSYDLASRAGRVSTRTIDQLAKPRVQELTGAAGRNGPVPLAVATLRLPQFGESTAVICRDTNQPASEESLPCELRLLGERDHTRIVSLGTMPRSSVAVLAASPDGRFLALAGHADNRIEIYSTEKLIANQDARVQIIEGLQAVFTRVEFLQGNRIWVGGPSDSVAKGGVVMDLASRKAGPNDGSIASDSPKAANARIGSRIVSGTGFKEITLPKDTSGEFIATAVAVLPAAPKWDPSRGAVVAIARTHTANKQTIISLYDAGTGKRLLDLEGPALPVQSLAFSLTRPVLAAVGGDQAIYTWSLRNLKADLPALSGVTVVDTKGEVVVESIEPGVPAMELLPVGSVIQAVGPEKGPLKPVQSALQYLLAIRQMSIGDKAQLQLKNRPAPVLVPVGTSVGHRHPLVTLWIDPNRENGLHNWVAWTEPGPYDTNSPQGEARIGWLTSTGNPAEPARYEGALQHRKEYYRFNLIAHVLDKADYNTGLETWLREQPRPNVELEVTLDTLTVQRAGRMVTRQKPNQMKLRLDDPNHLITLERAVLRWRTLADDGNETPWEDLPFASGQAELDLTRHTWVRGTHRFEFALFQKADADYPKIKPVVSVEYIPAAPIMTVLIDGKAVKDGDIIETTEESVHVAAEVTPGPEGDARLTLLVGDQPPLDLLDKSFSWLGGRTIRLNPESKMSLMVIARTQGANTYEEEAHTVGITVRRLPPESPPRVNLKLLSGDRPPKRPTAPLITDLRRVQVQVRWESQVPVAKLEWKQGDHDWVELRVPPGDRIVQLPQLELRSDGKPDLIRVRATNAKGRIGEDSLALVYTALPGADIIHDEVPETVTASKLSPTGQLEIKGRLEIPGTVPFSLLLRINSGQPGETREVVASVNTRSRTWTATIQPWYGENQISLVIRNEFREVVQDRVAKVTYLRPPVLVQVPPLEADGVSVAPLMVTALTSWNGRPNELLVSNKPVRFHQTHAPIGLLGLRLWRLRVESVPVEAAGERLQQLSVSLRNPDGESQVAQVPVKGRRKDTRPPTVALSHGDQPIGPAQLIHTDQQEFHFKLMIRSPMPLARVEIWQASDRDGKADVLPGVSSQLAKEVPGGYELQVQTTVQLFRGGNSFRIVAANTESHAEDVTFRVNYKPVGARITIERMLQVLPDGQEQPIDLSRSTQVVQAHGSTLQVHGFVEWDTEDDPVARLPNLKVVFVVNHVTLEAVQLNPPERGERKRSFVSRVYLPARQNVLRVELRSPTQSQPLPQQGSTPFTMTVSCSQPLGERDQRLHILVIGVDQDGPVGPELAKALVEAVGGRFETANVSFDRGVLTFHHPRFSRAMIYPPLVGIRVEKALIDGRLMEVERVITEIRKHPNQNWINDVVVIFYQGQEIVGKDGLRRIRTSFRLNDAVPLDHLYRTPGVRVPLLNVVDFGLVGQPQQDPFDAANPLLRYCWKDPRSRELLLPIIRNAVDNRTTLGEVASEIRTQVLQHQEFLGEPTDSLPELLRPRIIGRK